MRIWIAPALLLALTFSYGCPFFGGTSDDENDDIEVSEGTNDPETPFGMLGGLKEMAENIEQMSEDFENQGPVETYHFSKLIAMLPFPPEDWEQSEPEGETTTAAGLEVSWASAVYTNGDQQVTIKVTDTSFQKILIAPFMMVTSFSKESTRGYEKGIKVGPDPGREEYKNASKSGKRIMLLGKRFLYEIDIMELPPDAFDTWTKLANVAQFREAAATEDTVE